MTAVDVLRTPGAQPQNSQLIEPRSAGVAGILRELWRYRGLMAFFGHMYIRKFYANTWLGWIWLPLRPALSVGARVLVFGSLLKAPSGGVPYFIFFATGVAVWELLAFTWYFGTRSLELNRRYLKRIYVPRLVPLGASVYPGFLWMGLYGGVLAGGLGYFWVKDGRMYLQFGPEILVAVAGIACVAAIGLVLSLFTSIYGAQARDPRFFVRHALRFWFYMTPVIYPLSAIPDRYGTLAMLNPMTAPMEMIRYGLIGTGDIRLQGVAVTLGTIVVIGVLGLRFFGRSEAKALDYLDTVTISFS